MDPKDLLAFGKRYGIVSRTKKKLNDREEKDVENTFKATYYKSDQQWAVAAAAQVFSLEIAVVGYELKVFKTYMPDCKKPRRIRILLAGEHYMALLGAEDRLMTRLSPDAKKKHRFQHQFQSLNEPRVLTQ